MSAPKWDGLILARNGALAYKYNFLLANNFWKHKFGEKQERKYREFANMMVYNISIMSKSLCMINVICVQLRNPFRIDMNSSMKKKINFLPWKWRSEIPWPREKKPQKSNWKSSKKIVTVFWAKKNVWEKIGWNLVLKKYFV